MYPGQYSTGFIVNHRRHVWVPKTKERGPLNARPSLDHILGRWCESPNLDRYGSSHATSNSPLHPSQRNLLGRPIGSCRIRQLGQTAYPLAQRAGMTAELRALDTIVQRVGLFATISNEPRATERVCPCTASATSDVPTETVRYQAPRRSPQSRSLLKRAHCSAFILVSLPVRIAATFSGSRPFRGGLDHKAARWPLRDTPCA